MKKAIKHIILLSLMFPFTVMAQNEEGEDQLNDENIVELADELINPQKTIQSSYKNEKYTKCIRKSSERLDKGYFDKVAYYYLGLSTFKVYEDKLNEVLFDKSLIYLSSANINTDRVVINLKADDQLVLDQIHSQAIALSRRDFKKHRTRALKRLKYVAEIFQDTIDVYNDLFTEEIEINSQKNTHNITENKSMNNPKSLLMYPNTQLNDIITEEHSVYIDHSMGLEIDANIFNKSWMDCMYCNWIILKNTKKEEYSIAENNNDRDRVCQYALDGNIDVDIGASRY